MAKKPTENILGIHQVTDILSLYDNLNTHETRGEDFGQERTQQCDVTGKQKEHCLRTK